MFSTKQNKKGHCNSDKEGESYKHLQNFCQCVNEADSLSIKFKSLLKDCSNLEGFNGVIEDLFLLEIKYNSKIEPIGLISVLCRLTSPPYYRSLIDIMK